MYTFWATRVVSDDRASVCLLLETPIYITPPTTNKKKHVLQPRSTDIVLLEYNR